MLFEAPSFDDHQRVSYWCDEEAGLRAIVAQHRVLSGRAIGGCRFRDYPDDDAALDDVLRLSRGMTYKTALADLPYGGAKAVVLGDPTKVKTEAALRSVGRFVESLGGTYVTAEDVGMTPTDLRTIRQETRWVLGADEAIGPAASSTALGVFHALRGGIAHQRGVDELSGIKVAVQGVGSVGGQLCGLLAEQGCELIVADVNSQMVAEVAHRFGASIESPERIHAASADIFAPCALGATLNAETIPEIDASLVVGAANNQLARDRDGLLLHERGILYVADYLASAGGVIHGVDELEGYDRERVEARIAGIYETTRLVLRRAAEEGIAPSEAARLEAEARVRSRATTANLGAATTPS